MNDNKLIAEFMGRATTHDIWDNDSERGEVLLTKGIDTFSLENEINHYKDRYGSNTIESVETPLRYDESWDWLMPVIENCKSIHPLTKVMKEMITDIDDSIKECWGIESTHFRVVEFIKTYKNER